MVTDEKVPKYDIIICGGGLAGLSLARQLHINQFEASVLVLERLPRPLPHAGFKIGESTIESGAYYFYHQLQLKDHLEAEHIEKLGLRYFFPSDGDFSKRQEYGVAKFLPAKSYQIDRGKFESHLRALVIQSGVDLREDVRVKDIEINLQNSHSVTWVEGGKTVTAHARWVIDAMGRPRHLQRKFGLGLSSSGKFSSAWWRVRGKVSVNSFVDKSNTSWHGRVNEDRWQSTNHMMGKGYWVWLIPLAPDNTSVGIVTDESVHPFESYSTHERALEWLQKHEPFVAQALQGHELIDFQKLRGYSHTSSQVFSIDRWACVGVSGVFADPYYSVGSNMIGFANGYVQRMLELDRENALTSDYVEFANRYFIGLNDYLTETIHRGYKNHHNGPIIALKTIWDYFVGWATTDPQFYHETYLDQNLTKIMSGLISRITVAQARMHLIFEEWGKRTDTTGYSFSFIDYIEDLPTLKELHLCNLFPKTKDFSRLTNNIRNAVDRIEELAQVIFRLAVADVLPEKLHLFPVDGWINIEGISLHPENWVADSLFSPKTESRDLKPLTEEISRLFVVR